MIRKFQGRYQYKIDDKGRVVIPTNFREKLGLEFAIAKDIFENCIAIYTAEEFEKAADELAANSMFDKEAAKLSRDFYSNSFEGTIDRQGRVKLPAELVNELGIDRDVYLLGVGEKIEIWDREELEKNRQA